MSTETEKLRAELRRGLAALKTLHDSTASDVRRNDTDLRDLVERLNELNLLVVRIDTTVALRGEPPKSDSDKWKAFAGIATVIGSAFLGLINLLLHLLQTGALK